VTWISEPKGGNLIERTAYRLLVRAAIDLLPAWSREMLGLGVPLRERLAVRSATGTLLTGLRLAAGTPLPIRQALARCEARPIDV
jgi:uncharacterized protein (DUF2236 family)